MDDESAGISKSVLISFISPISSLDGQLIPLLQHQPPRPVLPVLPHLLVLQHAERFAWEVVAVNVFGVEDIAEFVAGKAISFSKAALQIKPME